MNGYHLSTFQIKWRKYIFAIEFGPWMNSKRSHFNIGVIKYPCLKFAAG